MNEMVEQVAAALYGFIQDDFDRRQAARVVIEAVREPTKKVLEAGITAAENALDSTTGSDADGNTETSTWLRSDAPCDIWRAMINAALS